LSYRLLLLSVRGPLHAEKGLLRGLPLAARVPPVPDGKLVERAGVQDDFLGGDLLAPRGTSEPFSCIRHEMVDLHLAVDREREASVTVNVELVLVRKRRLQQPLENGRKVLAVYVRVRPVRPVEVQLPLRHLDILPNEKLIFKEASLEAVARALLLFELKVLP